MTHFAAKTCCLSANSAQLAFYHLKTILKQLLAWLASAVVFRPRLPDQFVSPKPKNTKHNSNVFQASLSERTA